MEEEYTGQQFFSDVNTRLRDLEEKQRLLKERVLLVGQTFIDERDKNFKEFQDLKKVVSEIKEEVRKMKESLNRMGEQIDSSARREDMMILQRQFDLFRKT